uniref:Uncharacterized protein n=1 Tax=Schistocephalus solidus TaxID=70667 RepID=A0A0X3NQU7_SCHSO
MQARLSGDLASEPREQLKHNPNFCPLSSIHRGDNLCVASKANTVLLYIAQADTVTEFQETRAETRDKAFTIDDLPITSITVTGDSTKPHEEEGDNDNDLEKNITPQGLPVDSEPTKFLEGTMRQTISPLLQPCPSRTNTEEQSTAVGSEVRKQENISATLNVQLPVIKTKRDTCRPGAPGRHGVLVSKHPRPLPPYYAPALLKRLHDEYMVLQVGSKKRMVHFNRLIEP